MNPMTADKYCKNDDVIHARENHLSQPVVNEVVCSLFCLCLISEDNIYPVIIITSIEIMHLGIHNDGGSIWAWDMLELSKVERFE